MKRLTTLPRSPLALLAVLTLPGCGDALYDLLNQGPRPLRGQDAFSVLPADPTRAAPTDLASVMAVIADEERSDLGEPLENTDDPGVLALRRRSVQDRLTIREADFQLVDFEAYGDVVQKQDCALSVDPSDLFDEYLIPQVDRIPVKSQGYRGTCAAFAGVGAVEYAAINPKQGGYDVKSLDLSEQRFYWLSKPECHNGIDCGAGSWFGSGFDASKGTKDFPIPYEADCPYVSEPGNHETFDPQPKSCNGGGARVEQTRTWCGLNELIELLHDGYAVPVGSPLTLNWEQNEGLITKRDFAAQGSTVHAGGHAYLIVGYRRLPKMPEEGGLCLMVKNSWGKGWGVNGYACMTVAWMEAIGADRFTYGFPAVTEVTLADGGRRAPTPDPEPTPRPDPTPEPEPEPEPELVWSEGSLRGPEDSLHRVEVASTEDTYYLRANAGDADVLELQRRGNRLFFDGDEVGRIGEDTIVCTDEWSALCALRRDDDRLFVQFRDPDLRSVKEAETTEAKGEWRDVPLTNRPSALFLPRQIDANFLSDPKIFLRLNGSEPMRLALRPANDLGSFAIKLMGIEVGEIDITEPSKADLCTGGYSQTCRLLGRDRLMVLPGNRRAGKPERIAPEE